MTDGEVGDGATVTVCAGGAGVVTVTVPGGATAVVIRPSEASDSLLDAGGWVTLDAAAVESDSVETAAAAVVRETVGVERVNGSLNGTPSAARQGKATDDEHRADHKAGGQHVKTRHGGQRTRHASVLGAPEGMMGKRH